MLEYYLIHKIGLDYTDLYPKNSTTTEYREKTGLIALIKRKTPWLSNPEPKEIVKHTEKEGMDIEDAMMYIDLYNTEQEIKEEQREKEKRKAKRKSN